MLTRTEYVEQYAASHQNHSNQIIHLLCVPAIFFASLGIAWVVPLGRFIPGLPAEFAPWVNVATVAALPIMAFYALLGLSSFATGLVWFLLSFALCVALQSIGAPLLFISIAVWVAAWAVQFYGHKLEGAKPSFFDDMFFLLIGPLFVNDKLVRLVKTGSLAPH